MLRYVVAYAKMVDDKEEGIYLQGVYFGGVEDTQEDANRAAKRCVNTVKGGTIFPKIIPMEHTNGLCSILKLARTRFEVMESNMIMTEDVVGK